ncbi:sensor histidine kinase [Verrucomicrobiota bacterium sgz303538]
MYQRSTSHQFSLTALALGAPKLLSPIIRLMLTHEIRSAQLRALLLLLVLVPLAPTVLLLRFANDVAEGERTIARQRAEELYGQILAGSGHALTRNLATRGEVPSPADAESFYSELLGPDITVRIVDQHGKVLAGPAATGEAPLAQMSLASRGHPWEVQLFAQALDVDVLPMTKGYTQSALLLIVAILAIAAAAGLTLHRQFTLRDLKSTAVATVAHELRTPLASIRMLVDTLREGRCRSATQSQEYLDLIASEVERLSRVTDQFLTHSRLEHGQHGFSFAPVSASEVAEAAVHMLRDRLNAPNCRFSLQIFPNLPMLHADRGAVTTVIANLLENALKYTGTNKGITLRVRGASKAVIFEVMDNGIGLTKAECQEIFRPFRQADQRLSRSREGCGLGLSIVQQIVEAHHGRVSVDSTLGRGSCFTVRLPALAPAAKSNNEDPRPSTPNASSPA